MADVFSNRPEILEAKGPLQAAVRKATLKAWITNPPSDSLPEPNFITVLRSKLDTETANHHSEDIANHGIHENADAGSSFDALFSDAAGFNFDNDPSIRNVDWMLGNQMYCEPNTD